MRATLRDARVERANFVAAARIASSQIDHERKARDAEAARVDPDDDSEAARAANAEPRARPTPRPRSQYAAALDDVARERDGLFEELGELRLRHGHDAHSAQFNCARRTKGSALEAECAAWRRRGRGGGREDKERVLRRERDRREARGDAQKQLGLG